ncbi:MAG: hypothetical protein P0Y63_24750 [Klebsiella huaxiensis]|uniref:hypothetical protein n=1 Tax=Klebsiella huaxiensis TaxID=2153354 RepID=UPI0026F09596|nr:hypothetical protein [Klebsiella huaxiensis]WEJ88456.1 MAG: hypothetical protein P0Y63_24750 [Klebsiella huaxiensis]
MSILLTHQISAAMRQAVRRERRTKMVKAELALIRIQSLLGLSDDDLLLAVQRMIERDAVVACYEQLAKHEGTL